MRMHLIAGNFNTLGILQIFDQDRRICKFLKPMSIEAKMPLSLKDYMCEKHYSMMKDGGWDTYFAIYQSLAN